MGATEKSLLTPEQVCSIIEASGNANVRVLKFADLYLEFGSSAKVCVKRNESPEPHDSQASFWTHSKVEQDPTTPVKEMTEPTHQKMSADNLVRDEVAMRDAQLDQMRIENPLLFEQLLQVEGELLDDDDSEPVSGDDQGT